VIEVEEDQQILQQYKAALHFGLHLNAVAGQQLAVSLGLLAKALSQRSAQRGQLHNLGQQNADVLQGQVILAGHFVESR